jgi:hypothetical protein
MERGQNTKMSWIVGEYIRDFFYIIERANIDSDAYNNAIIIEKIIENMKKDNLISNQELIIIGKVAEGYSYSEIARDIKIHRLTVSEIFKNVTDRIAYMLGGEFTDVAFVEPILERMQLVEPSVDEDEIYSRLRRGFSNKKNDT